MAGLGSLLDFAHVAGDARKPEQTAPLVEHFINLRGGQALLACQIGRHAWIEVAAAGAHDQPFAGREPHGRVHRTAMVHGAKRSAIAEVAAHDFQLVHPPLQVLRAPQADVRVRPSVESVAAHALRLVILVRQTVKIRVGRQRVVKRGVEHGHVRRGREHPARLSDAGDIHRIVQRRERVQAFHLRENRVIDHHRLGESLAAMHHAMADHANLRWL